MNQNPSLAISLNVSLLLRVSLPSHSRSETMPTQWTRSYLCVTCFAVAMVTDDRLCIVLLKWYYETMALWGVLKYDVLIMETLQMRSSLMIVLQESVHVRGGLSWPQVVFCIIQHLWCYNLLENRAACCNNRLSMVRELSAWTLPLNKIAGPASSVCFPQLFLCLCFMTSMFFKVHGWQD